MIITGAHQILAIDLLKASHPDMAAVDAFMKDKTFPLVEGTKVTFIFRGAADGVYLKTWVYGLDNSHPLHRVGETDLWYLTLDIPRKSRVEYKLEIVRNGHGQWIQDPLNKYLATDPFGANSVVHGEGYVVPEWTQHDPEARPGTLQPWVVKSRAFNDTREFLVYLPARFRKTRRYPLIFVHDGPDYMRFANLRTVLDNLIHRLEIPDLIVALSGSPNRIGEYANDERHARFVTEEAIPDLEARLPLIGQPRGRCLMGASFGGVASLSTAVRYPGFYGRLLLQSGSFAFNDIGHQNKRGPAFEPVIKFMNKFRENPTLVAEKSFISCGMHESLIYENRSLVPMLQATGMELRYVEARDGHNWENWRDRLREGLAWLFPGPLRLVYE
ncbi:MAG: alpha/beta hydrolase-fold protein [Myxococcaceae bacterium]